FTMLEPNGTAPFNALLAMTGSEATDDPEYRNFVDELPDRTFLVDNAGGYDANATTLSVDAIPAVGFVVEGSIIVNANTGEVMQATALGDGSSGSISVKRNIGGTALTISDNDELVIAGYAAKEGDNSPEAVSFDADVTFNYTQIFRTSYTVTNTLKATNLRTGDKEDEAQMKALKMHMSDIERAFLFGKRHIENPNSAQPTRY
ncbi:SU10 major capsid protein, partial [Endozoicomonas atrinae]|uniref:SU10 major capsid protein n=1 Tax=Endozoicomonas atrinae TaxID=1333660 RepID=UPI001586D56A